MDDMESTALTVADATRDLVLARPPEVVLAEAHKAATALKNVIESKPKKVMFNGEQYLEFEDWQTVGRFYGMTAKEDGDPEYVNFGDVQGFKASAVAIDRDGVERSRATAYCLNDEEKWSSRAKYAWSYAKKSGGFSVDDPGKDEIIWEDNPDRPGKKRPKKERVLIGEEKVPMFQLASMAQTRANAKALANVLRWVVVLAGYKATPAEEIQGEVAARTIEVAATHAPRADDQITRAQQKNLFARAREAGHSEADVKGYLQSKYGYTSTSEILQAQYEAVMQRLNNTKPLIEGDDVEFGVEEPAEDATA